MNVDEAKKLLKKKLSNVLVLNVRLYKDFYIFQTCPKDTVLLPFVPIIGGYYSVNRKTGNITTVNPKALPGIDKIEVEDLCGMKKLEDMLKTKA